MPSKRLVILLPLMLVAPFLIIILALFFVVTVVLPKYGHSAEACTFLLVRMKIPATDTQPSRLE
jgi:hypothetical protein